MQNTGATVGGTAVDDTTIGTLAWDTPEEALVDDNSLTQYVSDTIYTDALSHYLKITNFGFNLGKEDYINGIVVAVQRTKTVIGVNFPIVYDYMVKLVLSNGSL